MNEAQIERWNGSESDHWFENADRYDAQLAPFLAAIVETARIDGDAVLDVGCGCGALSLAVAPAAARVTGLDVSAPLLSVARDRLASGGLDNVEFVQDDAQVWPTEADPNAARGQFDIMVSRFGLMFFDDPVRAFTNLRSNLRMGGRTVFACWQDLAKQQWLLEPMVAAAPFLPPAPSSPPAGPGMFGLADPATVESMLMQCGFESVELADCSTSLSPGGPGTVADAVEFFASTGIARSLLDPAPPKARAAAIDAVTALFTDRHDGTGVHMDSAAWIVSATAA